MASWDKQLSKHTKSYIKRLERADFTEEELMVFKTICLMSLNSIIYFVEAMRGGNPAFTGIKPKQWAITLKQIEEGHIHHLYEDITCEYFNETLRAGEHSDTFQVSIWQEKFEGFISRKSDEHVVDKVFHSLYLDDIKRNEMPVMTFVEIFTSLFERIDAMLERNLELMKKK